MIPFPGESLAADSFENVSGAPIGSLPDIMLRQGVSGFATGDAAKVVVFFGINYLESDDVPGEVSWAVEILAESGPGTLTLTECLGDGTPDVPLGSFAVTGGDTLVVPSSAITLADVYNDLFGSLLIECDTGPVLVQQVKLRAFPVGGPLGGWGDALHPEWDRTSNASANVAARTDGAVVEGVASLQWNVDGGPTTIEVGWANTLGLMPDADADEGPIPVALGASISTTDVGESSVTLFAGSQVLPTPGESGGTVLITGTGMVANRVAYAPDINPAEGLEDGVDYIADPYEVWGDDGSFAQADTAPVNSWIEEYDVAGVTYTLGELVVTEDAEGIDPPSNMPLIGAVEWDPAVIDDELSQLWPDYAATPPIDLTLPDADRVLIAPSHVWFRGDEAPTTPGVPDPNSYSESRYNGFTWHLGTALQYATAMPPYRVWDINAVSFRPLRQLHRDDGRGGTPPRAFGGASRIRTGRAYGYD